MTEFNASDLPNSTVVYQYAGLIIRVSPIIHPLAIDLLKRTIYGTSGLRYQHTNQATKIPALRKPLFFHLVREDHLVGVYCLDERTLVANDQPVHGFYGRYLAVEARYFGNGYGRLLKQQALAFVEKNTPAPTLFYSYIEERNSRSLAISKGEGFQSIARLSTYFFRRFAPKVDARFAPATADELPLIQSLLSRFYQGYRLTNFTHIGYKQHYFVLREAGRIIAGVQANPVCWRFYQMAGFKGWMIMNLAPLLGLTRRFFNPSANHFLVLEGFYFEAGREALLPVLLESVLVHLGQHSAMCEVDQKDPLVALFTDKAMGMLSGFETDVTTHVLIKATGVSQQWLLTDKPVYTSCFDYA